MWRFVCCRHQQQVSKVKHENDALKDRLAAASRHLETVSDSRLQLEKSVEDQKLCVQRLKEEMETIRRTHANEVGSDVNKTAVLKTKTKTKIKTSTVNIKTGPRQSQKIRPITPVDFVFGFQGRML